MKYLSLTQGKCAIVDDCDFNYCNQWKWLAHNSRGKWYVQRSVRIGKKIKIKHLHREILQAPENKQVDHINGNSLDNRRINLRLCTSLENNRNARVRKDNTLGISGICLIKNNKFRAYIHVKKKQISLGIFETLKQAIHVRKEAQRRFWNEK